MEGQKKSPIICVNVFTSQTHKQLQQGHMENCTACVATGLPKDKEHPPGQPHEVELARQLLPESSGCHLACKKNIKKKKKKKEKENTNHVECKLSLK